MWVLRIVETYLKNKIKGSNKLIFEGPQIAGHINSQLSKKIS